MKILFSLFVIVPILEMLVLIKVGGLIGAIPTILLVVLTAAVGIALLRQQGIATILRAQDKLNSGQVPMNELIDGLFLAVGGALLLTPGFVTDTFGFACLIPGLRQLLLANIIRVFKPNIVSFGHTDNMQFTQSGTTNNEDIIEGEFQREKDH